MKVPIVAWGDHEFTAKLLKDRYRMALFKCPGCERWFATRGRARYCSDACKMKVYRRRRA